MSRALCLFAALAACSPSTPDGQDAPVTPSDVAPSANEPAPAPTETTWTVSSVQAGDIACYIELTGSDGALTTYMSDFEFCPGGSTDATPLVGRPVSATFTTLTVQAASCQGNPDCPDSEEVQGIASLTPAG